MPASDIQVAAEAEARLPEMLDRVERSEQITITRHGRPAARLIPAVPEHDVVAAQAALEALFTLGDALVQAHGPFSVEEILSARDEGRR